MARIKTIFPLRSIAVVGVLLFGYFEGTAQCSQWNTTYPNQCTNSGLTLLTGGTPSPGVYFGPGVIGSGPYNFSPISAGVGTHTLGYTANSCSDTAFVTITVNATPNVTFSTLGPYCENQDSIALTGGLPTTGGTGFYFGSGVSSGSGNFGPTVGSGGSPYQLSYTFTNSTTGCSDTASISVIVNSVTAASISGLDTAYCSNQIPQSVPVTTGPSGGTLTGPGISGSNFNIGNAGVGNHTIKYYFINGNNCTDTASTQVHVRALPTVSLSIPAAQKFACEFDGAYGITGQSPSTSGWPTAWFTGNGVDTVLGTFDPDPGNVGWNVITFNFFDGVCSNFAIDSILVNQNPTVTLNAFPSPCANDNQILLNQGTPAGGTYSGTGVSGIPGAFYFDPTIAGAGTHTITYCYTGPNNCETCVSQNIVVNPIPAVVFNSVSNLCENSGRRNLNTSTYVNPVGGTFSGPGISTDGDTIITGQLGPGSFNITYTYTDTNGCQNSATQNVTIFPVPTIQMTSVPAPSAPVLDSANIEIKICSGDSAIMNYSSVPTVFNLQSFFNYRFTQIGGDYIFNPDTNFFYPFVAASANCIDTVSVQITVIQPAQADIQGDTNICIGDTATLTAVGATTYQWLNPAVTTASIMVNPTVNTPYSVIALSDLDGDGNQCSSDTTATEIVVNPLPLINTGVDTTIFLGDNLILRAYAGNSYFWSAINNDELSCQDCNRPIATPIYNRQNPQSRTYYVIGTDSNGCENADSIVVSLNPRIVIFVPTAFSPNGDGFNDELVVKTKGIKSMEFQIYDRFGRAVYESRDLDGGWDGTVDGELLSKDVYLWKMIARPFQSGIPIEQAGQISLIR
ncbi:MAG: gliding motility-associated C-terminal domain-containing protein [Vicingaceae bacterium]